VIPHDRIFKEVPFVGSLLKKETDHDYFAARQLGGGRRPGRQSDAYRMLY